MLACAAALAIQAPWHAFPSSKETEPARTLSIAVGIPPQAGIVEAIGGERVIVEIALPTGRSPHDYSPSPRQIEAISRADIFFRIGLPLEDRILAKLKSASGRMEVVDTTRGMTWRDMSEGGHNHGHAHTGRDPHVWLSPHNLLVAAQSVEEALSRRAPQHKSTFRQNHDRLKERLRAADRALRDVLASHRGRSFYVFHPAFGYFADAYGLVQRHVEQEGKKPTARDIGRLIKEARQEDIRIIFVQPQHDTRAAQTIASAVDGALVTIDPLGRDPVSSLEEIGSAVSRAFGASREES